LPAFLAGAVLHLLACNLQASTIAAGPVIGQRHSGNARPESRRQCCALDTLETNGVTTTRFIFLVDDGTGSMDIFATPSGGTLAGGYVPAVGDNLTMSGPFSPFSGIPEMGTPTAITKNSSVIPRLRR